MVEFVSTVVREALPAAALISLLASVSVRSGSKVGHGHASILWLVVSGALGSFVGGLSYAYAQGTGWMLEFETAFTLVAMVLFFVATLVLSVVRGFGQWGSLLSTGAVAFGLGAWGGFRVLYHLSLQNLSHGSVLNTEFLLNLLGIAGGVLLVLLIARVLLHYAERTPLSLLACCFGLCAVLLAVEGGGTTLLNMMRVEWVELTRFRLSVVAVISEYRGWLSYGYIVLPALCALGVEWRRWRAGRKQPVDPGTSAPRRRLLLREERIAQAWLRSSGVLLGLMVGTLLYYDLYASQPPRISEPEPVTPGSDNQVRISKEEVSNGKLHRFSYTTVDGKVVRFFIINRFEDAVSLGVVYDACLLCGDMGYIQQDGQVICLACGVHIHGPTIGKPGGCNPIPLSHEQTETEVLIAVAELDRGGKLFSEVVSVEVVDPVTGARMINLDAPYEYEFKGRTYYFESEASKDRFREDPESYAGEQKARYFRAEGYKET